MGFESFPRPKKAETRGIHDITEMERIAREMALKTESVIETDTEEEVGEVDLGTKADELRDTLARLNVEPLD